MSFLVKQVSKSSATLEQTQKPGPKLYVKCLSQGQQRMTWPPTPTNHSTNEEVRKKADLSVSRRSQHPGQTP